MTVVSPARRPAVAARLVTALALVLGVLAVLAPAPAQADPGVVVNPSPDARAPRVMNGRVYAIDSHGPLVAVGGSFTTLRAGGGGADVPRQWLFIYNSETGAISNTFVPQLGGPAPAPDAGVVKDQPGVEAIQFAPDGQSLYVGGWFTTANGVTRNRLVRLALDGSVISAFAPEFNNVVSDMELTGNRLIVGGKFGRVNGQPVEKLVSIDPTTGATQSDFNLPATESRNQYGGYVNELDVSDDGRWMVVSGSFKKVGTASRNQLALIDLQGRPSVANWSTDLYAPNCSASSTNSGSYIRGVSIAPDSSYLVVSTTGAYISADSMCDTAARFEMPPTASGDNLRWTWRAKTGGDTLWANKATESAVYVGGHQRWLNNPLPTPGGDNDGPGSVVRAGVAALDPLTGVPLSWNPSRDRGRGAETIYENDKYLFVGHDTNLWGGAVRQRLAQLPFAGGKANPQPVKVDLPANLWFTTGTDLARASFDGATLGAPTTVSSPGTTGENWSTNRGGFVQDGRLHYFGATQAFYSRPWNGDGTVGAATNLSTSVGYVDTNYNNTPYDQPYGVAETTAATYSNGQIYYVKSGDSKLYQRGYSLESGIVEGSEYVASSQNFSAARGLAFIGDWLYAAWSDGKLYRFYAPNGQVQYGSRTLVDNGGSVNWANVRGFWATAGSGSAVPPTAPTLSCSGATPWKASYWPNITFAGAPNTTRCEAAVDYTWGTAAPTGAEVPGDNFAVKWTRTVTLADAGAIAVQAQADDGIRVFVDGKRVIDAWRDGSGTTSGTSGALAAGDHEVRVEFYERGGSATARVNTSVVAAPPAPAEPDNLAPETTLTAPAGDVSGTSPVDFTATGTATDNAGVASVRVALQNRTTSQWLQANGTWGSTRAVRTATLGTPGGTSTTWSLNLSLPHGSYAIEANARDAAGNEDPSAARRTFAAKAASGPADTTKPTVTVTTPALQQQVTTSTLSATGTASDDVGVAAVRVAVWNRAGTTATRWLQADGSWGQAYAFRTATLASPGATSTGWTLDVPLPNGSYALDVRARDAVKNETDPRAWVQFTVASGPADNVAPTVAVAVPPKNGTLASRAFTASGSTADGVATSQVRVAVYDRTAGVPNRWLRADGTWGSSYTYRFASVTNAGARSSDWSLSLDLPEGIYALDVKGVDAAGNVSSSLWQPFTVNAPDADKVAPKAALAKRNGAVVAGRKLKLVGTAKDDKGVRKVLVAIARRGSDVRHRWLQADGGWAEVQSYRVARLAKAGRRATAWHLGLKLKPGKYTLVVLSTDKSANVQRSGVTRKFRVRAG